MKNLALLFMFVLVFLPSNIVSAQEDIETLVSISRGGISLRFPKGSLTNCRVEDGVAGKARHCVLSAVDDEQTLRLGIEFSRIDNGKTVKAIAGTIYTSNSIAVSFGSFGEHATPYLRLKANALAGESIVLSQFASPGPFGAALRTTEKTITLSRHTELYASAADSSGSIAFSARGLTINNVRMTLPGTERSKALAFQAKTSTELAYDLGSRKSSIVRGSFVTTNPVIFPKPATIAVSGITLPVGTQLTPQQTAIEVLNSVATAKVRNASINGGELRYVGSVAATGTKLAKLLIGEISSVVSQTEGALLFNKDRTMITDLRGEGDIELSNNPSISALVSGSGNFELAELSKDRMKGKITWKKLTKVPRFGESVAYSPATMVLDFQREMNGRLTAAGTISIAGFSIGSFSMDAAPWPLELMVSDGRASVTSPKARGTSRVKANSAGAKGNAAVQGPSSLEVFKAEVLGLDTNKPQLRIEPEALRVSLNKPSVSLSVAGGSLALTGDQLVFVNDRLTSSAADGTSGLVKTKPSVMTVVDPKVLPVPKSQSITLGAISLSSSSAYFTVDPQAQSQSPFGITGSFVAEGVRARFDKPTILRMNDIALRTTELAIGRFQLSLNVVKASVSFQGVELRADQFSMAAKEGKTESPSMTGVLAAPFSIAEATVDIPFTTPIELYNLHIRNVVLDLADVVYSDPTKSIVKLPKVQLKIASLSDEEIDAFLETNDGTYTADASSPGYSGKTEATLKRIKVELKGPRKPLRGSLELALKAFSARGVMPWNPLESCCGDAGNPNAENPNFHVPLTVSLDIPDLSGRFDFVGDLASGGLSTSQTSHLTATYLGPKLEANWSHSWRLQDETWWRAEYPCFGTWSEPVRTCEATGIALPRIDAKLRWRFVLLAIWVDGGVKDFWLVPKSEEREFACPEDPDLCPGGKTKRLVTVGLRQCKGHLVAFDPLKVAPAFSLTPDLAPGNGDIAKLFNDLFAIVSGYGQSAFLSRIGTGLNLFANNFYVFKDCPNQ